MDNTDNLLDELSHLNGEIERLQKLLDEKEKTYIPGIYLTQWGSDSYELAMNGQRFEINRYDLEILAEQMREQGFEF